MPPSTQALYFQLGMNADDDGFCEHFTIMRMVEAKPDDLKILQAKGLVVVFDDRVLVITDWKENNFIRNDRYTPSKYLQTYKEEMAQISRDSVSSGLGIPMVDQRETEVRLGKVSIGKDRERGDATFVATPSQIAKSFFERGEEYEGMQMYLSERMPTGLVVSELEKFWSYWTEPNKSGTKVRWQLEPTFDIRRRIATWMSRVGIQKGSFTRGRGVEV